MVGRWPVDGLGRWEFGLVLEALSRVDLTRLSGRGARLCELALVVALAGVLANAVLSPFAPGLSAIDHGEVRVGSGAAGVGLDADLRALQIYNPFARASAPEAVAVVAAPVVQTRLNLTLAYVNAVSDDPLAGSAGIRTSSSTRERLYVVGDEISPGVTLHKVYDGYVELANRGVIERLAKEQQPSVITSVGPTPTPEAGGGDTQAGAGEVVVAPSQVTIVSGPVGTISAGEPGGGAAGGGDGPIELTSPGEFMLNVSVSPGVNSGGREGLILSPSGDVARFEALGFRRGDMLVRVDGVSIANVGDLYVMAEELAKTSRFSVELERDGVPVRVDYWVQSD